MSFNTKDSMSDKRTQEEGELIPQKDTETPDAGAESAEDTEEIQEDSDGEKKQETLNLDEDSQEESKTSQREEQRLKQIESYQKKIDSGEIKSEGDIPKDSKWLLKDLTFESSIEEKVDVRQAAKEAAREVLVEEKEAARFETLKEGIGESDINNDQIKKLNERYATLRKRGLTQLDALETSMEIVGIDLKDLALERKRSKLSIPKPGSYKKGDVTAVLNSAPYSEAKEVVPAKERLKYLRKLTEPNRV